MESEKTYLKKTLGKNENNDLRDMVRSTSKSEGRRVKVSLMIASVSPRVR